ncbi:hypothetical protein IIB79_11235, partial [candidate division KSB1 bacterium]|nr:hypothetical protein [candidate division KSB1 bacterium]
TNPRVNKIIPGNSISLAKARSRKVFGFNKFENASIYMRENLRPGNRIKGPAVIHEYSSTTYVPKDFNVRVDEYENIIMRRKT